MRNPFGARPVQGSQTREMGGGLDAAAHSVCKADRPMGYLPLVSTFCFSSSFIFLTVGSGLDSPVVWVVVAAGLALGTEDCAGEVFAGRVAVVSGGGLVWADRSPTPERRTLATNAANVVILVVFITAPSSNNLNDRTGL
jgi:hypothetical protein